MVQVFFVDSPMLLDVSEEERLNIFDIDTEEGVSGFSEYALEIFKHLREAEVKTTNFTRMPNSWIT